MQFARESRLRVRFDLRRFKRLVRASGRIGLDLNKRFDFFDVQANKIPRVQAKLAAAALASSKANLSLAVRFA